MFCISLGFLTETSIFNMSTWFGEIVLAFLTIFNKLCTNKKCSHHIEQNRKMEYSSKHFKSVFLSSTWMCRHSFKHQYCTTICKTISFLLTHYIKHFPSHIFSHLLVLSRLISPHFLSTRLSQCIFLALFLFVILCLLVVSFSVSVSCLPRHGEGCCYSPVGVTPQSVCDCLTQ